MEPTAKSELLKLPPGDRAELAMTLWESLTESEREAGLEMTPELAAELDPRWAEHLKNPGAAIPWNEVEGELMGGE